MNAYRFDKDTKEYTGTQNCQLDPLASQKAGENIYLVPANCTLFEPPATQVGYARVWNGSTWEQIEDNRGKQAYNSNGMFTIKYIGGLKVGDNLLTDEQLAGLQSGALIFKDGAIITKPAPSVLEQIEALENSITPRNYREAIINPNGWAAQHIANINAQIEALRAQL